MNSSRPRTAVRLAVLGIAALLMSACSTIHTGSAAVVDGDTISMKAANTATSAYCKWSLAVAQQQGVKDVSSADTRRQAVTDLVASTVARKLVESRDLRIDPNKVELTADQVKQLNAAFPKKDVPAIRAALERSQYTYVVVVALGEQDTGLTISDKNQAQVEKAGQAALTKALKASDIEIDPRFGLDDVTKPVSQTGSLSVVPVAEDSDPAALPKSQRCS